MDREIELRVGPRIDAVLDRIAARVGLNGMAAKWHIGKAENILKDPEHLTVPMEDQAKAEYRGHLPLLISRTKEADDSCAEAWRATGRETADYVAERDKLQPLLQEFRLHPKLYERLVRQPHKPMFHRASKLIDARHEGTSEAAEIEGLVRMSLRNFVALEAAIYADLRDLDAARKELWSAHEQLAEEIAQSYQTFPEAHQSAMIGLRRAASWYDYKPGFSFREYAQYWVRDAVEKRRGRE